MRCDLQESDTRGENPRVLGVRQINKLFLQDACDTVSTFTMSHSGRNTGIQTLKVIQQHLHTLLSCTQYKLNIIQSFSIFPQMS